MRYKIRNPFYKIEKGVEKCSIFAMSIGEEDQASDNENEELLLCELDPDEPDMCQYRRFKSTMFKGINTQYGQIFKLIITEKPLETKIEIKPTKNKEAFKKLDDYHWEHID